jgi:hypothetical protein
VWKLEGKGRQMRKALIYLVCLPWDLAAWTFMLLLCVLNFTPLRVQHGCLALELRHTWLTGWWLRRWSGAAIGHAIIYKPGGLATKQIDTALEVHENFHVRQYEGSMTNAAIYGSILGVVGGNYIVALCAWGLGGVFYVLSNSLVALLRGEDFYRDSAHERGARGVTESWIERSER